MNNIFFFLSFVWIIRTAKAILFWLYLWQLKEYHIGRFLDHFQTAKGKRLLFNELPLAKAIFVPLFFYLPLLVFFLLILIYIFEAVKTFFDFFKKTLKKPVLTQKTALLIFVSFLVEIIFILTLLEFWKSTQDILMVSFWFLVFDVFTPVIASLIVLILQPLAVFGRNRILQKAKRKREKLPNLLVVGITGSYGKTSTKEFLAAILSEKYKVLKTKEHQNSEVGISLCILNDLDESHEIFIVEMGAYNRGGIKLLCDIAKPKIGVLTGINEQHMATFGSQENIIKGKYELIESLPKDGTAFFNGKNKYCRELYEKTEIKKILYGQEAELTGTENISGAITVAKELGMSEEEINKVAEKIKNKTGGFRLKKGINGLKIIDATYSANPDGVMVHLDYLKNFPGRRIIIMPCLIELGMASKEVHKRIGRKIADVCNLATITTEDRFKEIKEGFIAGGGKKENLLFMENPKDILEKIKNFCKEGDIILLESRVPNQLIKKLTV